VPAGGYTVKGLFASGGVSAMREEAGAAGRERSSTRKYRTESAGSRSPVAGDFRRDAANYAAQDGAAIRFTLYPIEIARKNGAEKRRSALESPSRFLYKGTVIPNMIVTAID
jgi:hypothetical protein